MNVSHESPSSADCIERRHVALALAVATFVLLADLLFAQRVPLGTGYHWDGASYLDLAANLPHRLGEQSVDKYFYGRLLPPALVRIGLGAMGIALSAENLLRGFVVLNHLAVLAALAAWIATAQLLSLGTRRLALGAIGIFVNFCFLKYNSFNPPTTDVLTFCVSAWMLYCHLKGKTFQLAALSFLGGFCWPTLLFVGAILLTLPCRQPQSAGELPRWAPSRWITMSVAGGLAVALAIFGYTKTGWNFLGAPALVPLLPLSFAIVGAYVAFATAPLADEIWRSLRGVSRIVSLEGFLLGAALALAVSTTVQWFAAPYSRTTVVDFASGLLATSIKAPAVSLVAHCMFFGPVICLAILRWDAACRFAGRFGPGYLLVMLMTAGIATSAESRQLMGNIAFVLVPVIAALDPRGWSWARIGIFGAVALVLSRFWLFLDPAALVFSAPEYLKFPWQWYFGAVGYWMSYEVYVVQLTIFAAVSALLLLALRKPVRVQTAPG